MNAFAQCRNVGNRTQQAVREAAFLRELKKSQVLVRQPAVITKHQLSPYFTRQSGSVCRKTPSSLLCEGAFTKCKSYKSHEICNITTTFKPHVESINDRSQGHIIAYIGCIPWIGPVLIFPPISSCIGVLTRKCQAPCGVGLVPPPANTWSPKSKRPLWPRDKRDVGEETASHWPPLLW